MKPNITIDLTRFDLFFLWLSAHENFWAWLFILIGAGNIFSKKSQKCSWDEKNHFLLSSAYECIHHSIGVTVNEAFVFDWVHKQNMPGMIRISFLLQSIRRNYTDGNNYTSERTVGPKRPKRDILRYLYSPGSVYFGLLHALTQTLSLGWIWIATLAPTSIRKEEDRSTGVGMTSAIMFMHLLSSPSAWN